MRIRRKSPPSATAAQIEFSKPKRAGMSSKYLGVSQSRGRWLAQITAFGKVLHLGRFRDEDEAARAYDVAALERDGAFTSLNFPTGPPKSRGMAGADLATPRFSGGTPQSSGMSAMG